MPKPWRLAQSLIKLREQVNSKWPERSKVSDGSIGDAAHASRASDHNPWVRDSSNQPVVTAIDITHDPEHGCDGAQLSLALIADPRVKYVIFNRRIWKSRTGQWSPYTGPNPHNHHVHVSVKPEQVNFDSKNDWPLPS